MIPAPGTQRLIALGIGGDVEWYAPARPDAAPTVSIVDTAGAVLVPALTPATLDGTVTVLTAGTGAGARSLDVGATVGMAPNRRMIIAGGATGQDESVDVESFSGTTVYLKSPTYYPHPVGAAFVATRISYLLPAAIAVTVSSHCRAKFSWKAGTIAQPEGVIDFVLTRHPLYCPVEIPDLLAMFPMLDRCLSTGTDLTEILARAWSDVLDNLWARGVKPESLSGTNRLKRPVRYHAMMLCAEQFGTLHAAERDYWVARAAESLEVFIQIAAIDDDGDNAIELSERHQRGGDQYSP